MLGNIAAKPDKVKILGVRFFDRSLVLNNCDMRLVARGHCSRACIAI